MIINGFKQKYLKYKLKYLQLKKQIGGRKYSLLEDNEYKKIYLLKKKLLIKIINLLVKF